MQPVELGGRREGRMFSRTVVSMAVLVVLCLAASPGNGEVPKLLILEHYPDYWG
jgi:hypothetical protein